MKIIPESGLFYPNNLSRILLLSLEDVIGQNGLKAILNLAGQSNLIGNFPPHNTESEFNFSSFSMIIGALDDLYGQKGSRVLALRAGDAVFQEMLKDMGEPMDIESDNYQAKPLSEKIQVGLSVVRNKFSKTKTASIPQTEDGQFLYSVQYCPVCWGRTTTTPDCFLISGLIQASIRWATKGQEISITQKTAHSCGDPSCDFIVPNAPIN
jgi:hypothetical protein